jgi:flagellin
MSISILSNIPSLVAQNDLSTNQKSLQKTLFELASGSRINSGADDAAGLAIADGLKANITALNQSAMNASDGTGALQVADGALSQVTTLLNRAVTLATEASTGTVSSAQRDSLNAEYTAIKSEIDSIGTSTSFNGQSVFSASTTSIYLTDGTSTGQSTISVSVGTLSSAGLGLAGAISGNDGTAAQTSLTQITAAIQTVANDRGTLGASMNRLQAAVNVINTQVQNLSSAEDGIRAADIPTAVSDLSRYSVLNQTGISALAQANAQEQSVLSLLH